MKSRSACILITLLAALTASLRLTAQDVYIQPHQYHHYQINDVGTFGGPQSWQFNPGVARTGLLNNRGTLVGSADTSAADPYCIWAFYPDCHAAHAFQWQNGGKTDLGVLPGGIGSQVFWISANGLMAGISDKGQQDPLNPALPQIHAVLWEHGQMTDLGTLAGGYDSGANAVNSRGEIAGQAYNTIPDANSLFGYGYQSRAVYWNNGVVQDLGTLGTGTDAVAGLINERGQVVGMSYTSSVPNALCPGISAFTLTTGSFLWDRKNGMKDIGGLGGTCTLANDLNNHGQIVGGSALTGDTQVHPFVWNAATGVTDLLDSSDSSYGFAEGENAHGDVAGGTCDSVTCYALLWRKSGGKWQTSTLSTVTDNAFSISVNASEQVIGNVGTTNGTAPFLWEDGGPIVDLNTLVPPGSGLQMYEADQINDRGEIVVQGVDASGNNHAVLLTPCDDNHPGIEGCDYSLVDAATAAQSAAPRYIPNSSPRPVHPWRSNHSSAVGGAAVLTPQISPMPDFTKPPPQFWVAATPLAPSPVNPGGSATSSVTAGLGTGVATVTLTCSVQPSPALAPTCSISPASYTFGGTPSTLTVSTFGPSGRLLSHPGSGMLYALWLPLFGLVGTGVGLGSTPKGQKRKLKAVALACALLAGLTFQLACGGSSRGSSGTPAGMYSVTVTATGFIPVASTVTLTTLTVQ